MHFVITVSHSNLHTVVRAMQPVNGKWHVLECQNSVTPEQVDSKFGTTDNVIVSVT